MKTMVVIGILVLLTVAAVPSASANRIVWDNVGVGLAVVDCGAGDCGQSGCGGIFGIIECGQGYGGNIGNLLLYGECADC